MTVDIRIETVLSEKLSMGHIQNRSFFRHSIQNNDQGELPPISRQIVSREKIKRKSQLQPSIKACLIMQRRHVSRVFDSSLLQLPRRRHQ